MSREPFLNSQKIKRQIIIRWAGFSYQIYNTRQLYPISPISRELLEIFIVHHSHFYFLIYGGSLEMKQVPIYKKVTKNNGVFFVVDVRAMAREHINLKFSAKNSSILYSLLIMSCYILQLNPLQIHGLHHTNNSVQYMSSTSKQYRASHHTTLFSPALLLFIDSKGNGGSF